METIIRDKDVVFNNDDLSHLYTFKDFPVFMGCTNEPIETDLKTDMSWYISDKSGMIQLNPLLPLDIVYMSEHGSGTVGKSWEYHHKSFAEFINRFDVKSVLEIGGLHGILSKKFYGMNPEVDWTIIEPNPIVVDGVKAKVIQGFFDDNFTSEDTYDTVVHSHVFEHVYQPNDFINHISTFLDSGLLIFSIPNMDEMIKRGYTNCINFEHTILLGEEHVEYLLSSNGFEIMDKEYYKDDHSIFYCAKKINDNTPTTSLSGSKNKYETQFNNYIETHLLDVSKINEQIKSTDLPVYLFGAHVFSQYLISFGLETDKIVCLLDNDSSKWNKRLYGTNLKVHTPKVLKEVNEGIVILRAGVYNDEIKNDILDNINPNIKFI
jgi:2-polyprenyl-3-methyl-5-hydroxy-6-metoxy-1,4-benzoquinol methylase